MSLITLKSPRFSGNNRLKAAANNAPTLRKGAAGEAVRILQKALIDQSFPLPVSTKKHGSPDGGFGSETKEAVIKFQQKYSLKPDGVIGTNTMKKLDELFPDWVPAPPPVFPTTYQVPGIRNLLKQPNNQTCWAVVYTMMRSWRDFTNYEVPNALRLVGGDYVMLWNLNRGLDLFAVKNFYKQGGLKFEDLQSLTVEGWIEMLMTYGMLMIGTSYEAANNGLHANLVWGVFGDGTIANTKIAYIDPKDGVDHYESFASFHKRFLGVEVIEDGLDTDTMDAFVQIAHF